MVGPLLRAEIHAQGVTANRSCTVHIVHDSVASNSLLRHVCGGVIQHRERSQPVLPKFNSMHEKDPAGTFHSENRLWLRCNY